MGRHSLSKLADTLFLSSAFLAALVCVVGACDTADPLACNEHGTCVSGFFGDTCSCRDGYSGDNCETQSIVACPEANAFNDPGRILPNITECFHGAPCEEVVQGEVYVCHCPVGYYGDTCTEAATQCNGDFCYNGGECKDDSYCDCPEIWKSTLSSNCSVKNPALANMTINDGGGRSGGTSGVVIFFSVLGALVGVGAIGYGAYYYRTHYMNEAPLRFHEMKQIQMQGGPDAYDNDDAFSPESPLREGQGRSTSNY